MIFRKKKLKQGEYADPAEAGTLHVGGVDMPVFAHIMGWISWATLLVGVLAAAWHYFSGIDFERFEYMLEDTTLASHGVLWQVYAILAATVLLFILARGIQKGKRASLIGYSFIFLGCIYHSYIGPRAMDLDDLVIPLVVLHGGLFVVLSVLWVKNHSYFA